MDYLTIAIFMRMDSVFITKNLNEYDCDSFDTNYKNVYNFNFMFNTFTIYYRNIEVCTKLLTKQLRYCKLDRKTMRSVITILALHETSNYDLGITRIKVVQHLEIQTRQCFWHDV